MTVSVRLPIVAGAIAAVSAAAVVVPAAHPDRLAQALATSSVPVALSAWANPVNELLATLELTNDYLLGAYYNEGAGGGVANWRFAGFDQTGGDLLNTALATQKSLGFNSFVGNVANTVNNATPILRQLQVNLGGYLNVGLNGLNGAVTAISSGVWGYPAALIDAAQLALNGQIGEAFNVLVDAVVAPATAALNSLLTAGAEIGGDLVARLGAVIATIPENITKFAGWAIAGSGLLAEKTSQIFTTWVGKLTTGDFEGAWNTAIEGLLGPSGLPGLAINVSLGAGVQTGPIDGEEDIAENFVPSLRTAVNSTVWNVQEAMTTTAAPLSAQARPAAARAAAVPAPRAAGAESAAVTGSEAAGAEATAAPVSENDTPATTRSAAPSVRKGGDSPARAGQQSRTARASAAAR